MLSAPLSFVRGGIYDINPAKTLNQGIYADYIISKPFIDSRNPNKVFEFVAGSNYFQSPGSNIKGIGFTLRCVVR